MQKASLGRVYVWEIPVRLYHWLNALCISTIRRAKLSTASPLDRR